jgi:peptide/nickel transport system ATP-binding protein
MALLEVRGLTTEFDTPEGTVHAVNGVTFDVQSGHVVGVVGETGCGKSVTVRSVLGLVRPPGKVVAGSATFDGTDLVALAPRQLRDIRGRKIGFIAQNPFSALNPILPIGKQFHNIIRAHERTSSPASTRRAHQLLKEVGIAGADRVLQGYAHELSGGMAQRVVIAMALILDPRLVIADEPTTGLDLTVQRQILDLTRALVSKHGRAMLLVTHDLGVVANYCDEVVVMYAGQVVEQGPVSRVFGQPGHPYTAALLAAIPRRGHELVHLPGRIPSLIDYPVGCPFAPRCSHAFEPCSREDPALLERATGHAFACHLSQGVSAHESRTA